MIFRFEAFHEVTRQFHRFSQIDSCTPDGTYLVRFAENASWGKKLGVDEIGTLSGQAHHAFASEDKASETTLVKIFQLKTRRLMSGSFISHVGRRAGGNNIWVVVFRAGFYNYEHVTSSYKHYMMSRRGSS